LRWFTPQCEVDLCGHATLASGFVLMNILAPRNPKVRFKTRSGVLTVTRDADFISMDFPSLPPWRCENPPSELARALALDQNSSKTFVVFQTENKYFGVLENERQVRDTSPHFELLKTFHPFSVCITAPGEQSDFVSRNFVPSYGIPEDPVTGATHSSLLPYWSQRLGKQKLHARQLSKRGGEIWGEPNGDRVRLKGNAVLYLTGSISI
jgi:PhzF family phenazine biosynthesis protein